MAELQAKVEEEREWWESRKKGIQEGFMKELDNDEKAKAGETQRVPATPVKSGSDDDAVLVEAGGPAGSQGEGGGSAKKKKGKK